MVMLSFDASHVEPATGRDPVPAGLYLAVITGSEMKPTRNGAGQYLEFEYQILSGPHKGRKLWSRHNLHNANEQAVQMAHREVSAIHHAVGVLKTADTAELHDRPLAVTVKIKKREDNGEPTNEIVAWAKKDTLAGVPQQAGAPGGPATPPWLKR